MHANANAAIDRMALLKEIIGFCETDLLCYRAPKNEEIGEALRHRQDLAFDPVLTWVQQTYGVQFAITESLMPIPQPKEALTIVQKEFAGATDAELLTLAELCGILGSALLTLALWKHAITPEHAMEAARIDEACHAERYGLDPVVEAKWAQLEQIVERCCQNLCLS